MSAHSCCFVTVSVGCVVWLLMWWFRRSIASVDAMQEQLYVLREHMDFAGGADAAAREIELAYHSGGLHHRLPPTSNWLINNNYDVHVAVTVVLGAVVYLALTCAGAVWRRVCARSR